MLTLDIDTNNIVVGQVVKNYKELCALLGEEFKQGGDSRKAQLKEFARYFDWEKSGQKFLITDIYDTPLPKEDGRLDGHFRAGIINTYDVPKVLSNKTGVYKIQHNNMVYVGSTKVGFRVRYTQHCRGYSGMEHTRNLLDNGGIYSIIWIANDNDTEQAIRKKEQYYLELYRSRGYIIVNKEDVIKSKIKNIRLREKDYRKAVQILSDQGIKIIT